MYTACTSSHSLSPPCLPQYTLCRALQYRKDNAGPNHAHIHRMPTSSIYLVMGNTRLHWAYLKDTSSATPVFDHHWNTSWIDQVNQVQEHTLWINQDAAVPETAIIHGIPASFLPSSLVEELSQERRPFDLYIASVVPNQLAVWRNRCPYAKVVTATMALEGLEEYKTLGVDRALSLRGAGETAGWPCMVIDAGTALTFTCGDHGGRIKGGAILPGLRLSMMTLNSKTGQLPLVPLPTPEDTLPLRFATSTPGAIQSGVMYGALATIEDFAQAFQKEIGGGKGKMILTGGDAALLQAALNLREKRRQMGGKEKEKEDEEDDCWELLDDLAFRGLHWVVRSRREEG